MKYTLLVLSVIGLSHNCFSQNKDIEQKLASYKTVKLTTDVSSMSADEKQLLTALMRAAREMDNIFWIQSTGKPKEMFFMELKNADSVTRRFAEINYGPWDRLDDNKPFIAGYDKKPAGAGFYPEDMRKSEFDSLEDKEKNSPYTLIKRDRSGKLIVVPYGRFYAHYLMNAVGSLHVASRIASTQLNDTALGNYLRLRAQALHMDEYTKSDISWLEMKDNKFDIIIGPIENYEDQLYGIKTANEAYVLVKDMAWSKKLEKYVTYLPELQKGLPVDPKYKKESPGTSSQLNAYDVVFYAGDCNAGSKTIAVNLPNDETLQTEKGTRRSQLKNVMQAKFDYIMLPIAKELITPEQQKHITFNAFFTNTMFHEVAHGLGIKNTISGKGTVRSALGPYYSALEEGKADILGLYMVTQLYNKGVLNEGSLEDYYITFMAGIFRSVRFGAASAHGKANMIRFNYFAEKGAFTKDTKTGYYTVNMSKMKDAITSLSALILGLQGDGDLDAVKKLVEEKGGISADLQKDLDKLKEKNIPVDLVFEQGPEALGIEDNIGAMPVPVPQHAPGQPRKPGSQEKPGPQGNH